MITVRHHRILSCAFVLGVASLAGRAGAEPPHATGAASASSGASAPLSPADEIAERGFRAYEAGDFPTAIDLYLKAFDISGDARILFNVGAIYDKKLHDQKSAEGFYLRYLKSKTTEPDLVRKATERLLNMKEEPPAQTPTPAPAAPSAPPPAPPATKETPRSPPPSENQPLRTVALVAAGVGVVAIGIGSVFGLSALSKSSDLASRCPGDVCPNDDGPRLRDSASSAATLSTILFASGAVLAAAGVATYVLLRPTVGASSAGLSVSGSF